MAMHYSDPKRMGEAHALPNVETFYVDTCADFDKCPLCDAAERVPDLDEHKADHVGWYWQPCFPGCLPDGEPIGPFATKAAAIDDAQEGSEATHESKHDPFNATDRKGKARTARDYEILALAEQRYARSDNVDLDPDAEISEGDDNGAYVQVWAWVDFAGTSLDKDATEADALADAQGEGEES